MLIDNLCSVALYCQRCGKVQLRDVPFFSGQARQELHCSACGAKMAEVRLRPKQGFLLTTRCGACENLTQIRYSWRQLRHLHFEKLYCQHDHFELGYIGSWQKIAEFLDFNEAEYDSLHPEGGDRYLERQQILLEALTRVHELAVHGELACPCGSQDVTAGIMGDSIVLACTSCGSSCVLPMLTAEDLAALTQRLSSSWQCRSMV